MVMNQNNVPEERVRSPDSFPCYVNENGRMTVRMKVLHLDRKLVNFLPPEVIQNFPTVKALQSIKVSSRQHSYQDFCSFQPPTSNVQRRQPCRPVYQPLPKTNVYCNWQEFNFQMEKMKQSQILKRFKKLKQPSPEELRRERTTVENVDYHVFSPSSFSHRLPAKPLFSLICYQFAANYSSSPKLCFFQCLSSGSQCSRSCRIAECRVGCRGSWQSELRVDQW